MPWVSWVGEFSEIVWDKLFLYSHFPGSSSIFFFFFNTGEFQFEGQCTNTNTRMEGNQYLSDTKQQFY